MAVSKLFPITPPTNGMKPALSHAFTIILPIRQLARPGRGARLHGRASLFRTWCGTIGIAIAALVLVTAAEVVINSLIRWAAPVGSAEYRLTSSLVGLSIMMLGGYWAARFRPAAATVLAATQGLLVLALMLSMGDATPIWFQFAFLVLAPAATLAGGRLYLRRKVADAVRAR